MDNEYLFPIYYDGNEYFKEDCDEIFLCAYHCREQLNDEGGVYLSDSTWVYPDGSYDEF